MIDESRPSRTSLAWRSGNVLILLSGFATYTIAALTWSAATGYMTFVDPRKQLYGPSVISSHWSKNSVIHILVILLSSIAVAGLPAPRQSSRVQYGAACQAAAGTCGAAAAFLGIFLMSMGFFWRPENVCAYPSCWPLHEQYLALSLPAVLAGLAMLAMALLSSRIPWWPRALIPAFTWLILIGIQRWAYHVWLLPLFLNGRP